MGGETMKKLCPKTCGLCADDDDHDHESDDDDHHDDDSVCVDDDAKAVSLLAFASDNNVDDCASFVRFAELNGLNCDNALSSLSMFMMLTEEYKTEDDLKKICCFSCSVPELCTLDADSYESKNKKCRKGEESFKFCGKIQCITNPDCTKDKFGLDDPSSFICDEDDKDDKKEQKKKAKKAAKKEALKKQAKRMIRKKKGVKNPSKKYVKNKMAQLKAQQKKRY